VDEATLRRLAILAVPALALAYAVAVVVLRHNAAQPLTTYADASGAKHAADLGAGLGLLAAGAIAWLEPRTRRLGLLAVLAGIAWFGPDWEGWKPGASWVRSLGALAPPIFLALVFHLVLASPTGRVAGRWARAAVLAAYAVAVTVAVGNALFRDPFLDPYSWHNSLDNTFLVHADQSVAGRLRDVWLRAAIAVGALLIAIVASRLVSARPPARRMLWPVLVPGALVGAAEAAYAAALIHNPFESPSVEPFSSLFFALSLSVLLLATGLAVTVLRTRRRRAVVSRLAADLGAAPPLGRLRETLASAVGDPTLDVAYWLPASRRFVDSTGAPTDPPAAGGRRTVTAIVRGGEPVALVVHDAALVGAQDLQREIGSAARLAVENERLQAEVLAQLDDLQASRARIVETGDAERRRLERDLHDGAQQRLLAVSYDVRLARAAAEAEGDEDVAELLTVAGVEAQTALGELRELAHGIYPAILGEAGLAAAVAGLADEAAIPVELGEVTSERFSAAVETATYLTARAAVEEAAQAGASFASLELRQVGDRLLVAVEQDGDALPTDAFVHVADRIGALGGSLEVDGGSIRGEIPCA